MVVWRVYLVYTSDVPDIIIYCIIITYYKDTVLRLHHEPKTNGHTKINWTT